jgi:hypothetical protein
MNLEEGDRALGMVIGLGVAGEVVEFMNHCDTVWRSEKTVGCLARIAG